jgi:tetratricopeptide (TPR) repeat protein
MKLFLVHLLLCLGVLSVYAQSPEHELANLYFSNGEYDKAISYYEKFYNDTQDPFYLQRYVECLTKTNNGKDAEKFLLRYTKRNPQDYLIAVYLGRFYEDEGRKEDAVKHYRKLIEELPNNANAVLELSRIFREFRMFDWELETLLKGRKMLKDRYPLNTQLAEVYGALNRNEDMIDEYISLIDVNPAYKVSVQNLLSRYLQFDGEEDVIYDLARERLVEKVQKNPGNIVYTEMLIWLYTHRGNYAAALIQAKALDKRDNRSGRDVLSIGITCKNFGDYKTARSAFQYVLDLGLATPNYLQAEKELLNTLFIEITKERAFTLAEIKQAEQAYEAAIARVGKSNKTYRMMMELAEILAFYGNQPEKAKAITDEVMALPQLPKLAVAEAKMLKADIEVLLNNIWEAALLYMQIDKDFKYDVIGAEAKYKNARIFYYTGEFEFAQSQLDVLKSSTSKLISNDAMKLSVMITDNLGLDSNLVAMTQFARADLLLQQHKYEAAFLIYDSILENFPFHGLVDEILMRKAQAMQNQGRWTDAIPYLELVYQNHPNDITADDALMQLGDIYEHRLRNPEKAMEYYRKIMFDYKGSLHVIEARKRYRILSGDAPIDMVIPN